MVPFYTLRRMIFMLDQSRMLRSVQCVSVCRVCLYSELAPMQGIAHTVTSIALPLCM